MICGLATPVAAEPPDWVLLGPGAPDPSLAPSHRFPDGSRVSPFFGRSTPVHGKHYYRGRHYYPRNRYYNGWSGWGVTVTIPAYPYYRYYNDFYDDDYTYRTYRRSKARYYSGRPAPWTKAWYRYCRNKYRSFNSKTGYYKTYGGRYRLCR
ncbi:MAG: BA14K family protein [Hyphomicrobiales bacterium]|nr:BA14K family protein [Hyphomicrobiales bacterium]